MKKRDPLDNTTNGTNNIFILSLGQLVQSDLKKSILAFARILHKESKYFPYLTTVRVYSALLLDHFWCGTIDAYKKGHIESNDFMKRICQQVGIKPSDEAKDAWVTMCDLTENVINKIVDIIRLQKEKPFKLVVSTATNPLQYDYIMAKIDKSLQNRGLPAFTQNPSISIVKSFEEQELSLVKLTQKAITRYHYDEKGNNIISLHNILNKQNLNLKHAEFKSISTQPASWNNAVKEEMNGTTISSVDRVSEKKGLAQSSTHVDRINEKKELTQSSTHADRIIAQRTKASICQIM